MNEPANQVVRELLFLLGYGAFAFMIGAVIAFGFIAQSFLSWHDQRRQETRGFARPRYSNRKGR